MKLTTLLLTVALLAISSFPSFAAVTGRSEDTYLAGTEKLLSDSSGTDTYILVSKLWTAPVFSGTATGTYTLAGTPTITAPAISAPVLSGTATGTYTLAGTPTITAPTITAPVLSGSATGTYTLAGTPTITAPTITTPTISAPVFSGSITGTYTIAGTPTLSGPVISGGLTASGSGSNTFASSTGTFLTSSGANTFKGSAMNFDAVARPTSDDGAALGDTTHNWSDLFLASGGVINFNNGNVVLTQSSGILTMGTGELRVTTAGTNAASVPTLGSTSTLTNKTLTSPVIGTGLTASGSASNDFSSSTGTFKTSTGANTFGGSSHTFASTITPATDDVGALGTTSLQWSDLCLASGAVIRIANTNWVATHTSGILTVGTGDLRVTTAGTNTASVVTVGGTQTLTAKTLTAPTITAFTATGTSTIGAGLTATSPYLVTPTIKDLTEVVTATNVITAGETGTVFFLNSASEFVSPLPAAAAGLHFTFIVTAAPSGASYTIVTNASANIIKGNQNSVAGDAGDFGTADDTISFVDGQSVAGDKVELYCDGTNWFAYAISKVAAGVTFTQAD